MKRWLPLVAIAIGVLLAGYAIVFWSDDEDRIRARLAQLAAAVRIGENDTNVAMRALRLQGEFREIFVERPSVNVPDLPEIPSSRKELVQAAAGAANFFSSAEVSFGSVKVAVDEGGTRANVDATASLTGSRHGGEVRRDSRSVVFRFEKVDGEWQIASVTVSPRNASD